MTEKRSREAARSRQEAAARRALEERLATTLTDLDDARDAVERLVDELAARDDQLAQLRRRQAARDRDFRLHVELTRRLNEAREDNEQLRRRLKDGGGGGVVTISAEGRLRRTTWSTASSSTVTDSVAVDFV